MNWWLTAILRKAIDNNNIWGLHLCWHGYERSRSRWPRL